MDDSAIYVWGSYMLTLLTLGGEVLVLFRRRRTRRDVMGPRDLGGAQQVPR